MTEKTLHYAISALRIYRKILAEYFVCLLVKDDLTQDERENIEYNYIEQRDCKYAIRELRGI